MSTSEVLVWVNSGLGLLALAATLFLAGKAFVAYRRHDDRSMLLFGVGLLLVMVAPTAVALSWGTVVRPALGDPVQVVPRLLVEIAEQLLRLAGIGALVASLYVRE
ncbi:hypothetical protein [Halobacterium rubrum]|uniref:hypothetical protein n=1 Tax=Halobacterium TaxID=2239 RepID=UPI001F175B43|nr:MULTISPECIES: hypothetical protein [Halobacterium]MDH5021605.1 hypothetical protein [Halobacterium rubrum]